MANARLDGKERAKTPALVSGDAQKIKIERETAPTLDDCQPQDIVVMVNMFMRVLIVDKRY